VAIEGWKSPCHAAAQVGNHEKLKMLMSEINTRYIKRNMLSDIESRAAGLATSSDHSSSYRKKNIFKDLEQQATLLLKDRRYRKYRNFSQTIFNTKLEEYACQADKMPGHERFRFNFLDKRLSSPLHVASQYGHENCIEVLLKDYGCQIDRRNIDGWMAKDLVQHDKVRDAYRKHYKRIDQEIQKAL
jgi:hypothetical protein